MTLPTSGAITMAMINTELGFPSTNPISLQDPPVLALAGISAGQPISMSSFYGKTAPSTVRGSASPSSQTLGGTTSVSATTTISPAGGTSPYTYSTAIYSNGGASPTVTAGATTATPTVSIGGLRGSYQVTMHTVITDHTGATYTVVWTVNAVLSA
jgi:hypothetical protein